MQPKNETPSADVAGVRSTATVRGWIDVNDKLPDYDVNVLGIMESGSICVLSRCEDDDGWLWGCAEQGHDLRNADTFTDDVYEPTHWMPIPEAP